MKCSNCGNELPNNALFCDNCGQAVSHNKATSDKILCEKCGAEIEQGAAFCGECGSEIHTHNIEEEYIFCGNCGAKNPDYMQTCSNCGQDLHTIDNTISSDKLHSKKPVVIVAVLILLILGVAAVFAGYILTRESGEDGDNKTEIVTATQEPETATTKVDDINIANLQTYFVVNCDKTISLRETPDSTATILQEMPLGDPVSYVEPAQNGFAKVIYNGITGYALQAYLSNNPDDIQRPGKNNTSASESNSNNNASANSASNNQSVSGVVSNPTYNTYNDTEYKFTCSYPAHFIETYNSASLVRRALKASDNTATLNICGTYNSSNLPVETVQRNFKSSYPGTVSYENSGDDWCSCRTYKDGIYHYGYFKVKDGMIRGFEMHFDEKHFSVYDKYVNDIYDSLNFK